MPALLASGDMAVVPLEEPCSGAVPSKLYEAWRPASRSRALFGLSLRQPERAGQLALRRSGDQQTQRRRAEIQPPAEQVQHRAQAILERVRSPSWRDCCDRCGGRVRPTRLVARRGCFRKQGGAC
jgi:hypothetical protein